MCRRVADAWSQESRKQFRTGIEEIAKKADVSSAAWDIVCNASATHETNVRRIEVSAAFSKAPSNVFPMLRFGGL